MARTRRRCYRARLAGHKASRLCPLARQIRDIRPPRGLCRGEPRPGECHRVLCTTTCPSDKGPVQTHRFSTAATGRPVTDRLNLIANEQDVVLRAQLPDLAKISVRRDDDSRLSLNWLNKERSDILAMQLERSSNVFDLAISDGLDRVAITVRRTHTIEVWPKSIPAFWVCAHACIVSFQ